MKSGLNILTIIGLMALTSCNDSKPEPTQPEATKADITVEYAFTAEDGRAVGLDSILTVTPGGYTAKPEVMKMYISHLRLLNSTSDSGYTESESYHLLDASTTTHAFQLDDVPVGTYSALQVSFGVDSAHNHSLDQVGDLDPVNGMAWDWNTGYRFLVLEGKYTQPDSAEKPFVWHLGTDANFRTVTLPISGGLTVKGEGNAKLRFTANLNRFFTQPNSMPIPANKVLMMEPEATGKASQNVSESFGVSVRN